MKFDPRTWPHYGAACCREVADLLRAGGSLSKYRANLDFGVGPEKGSHAERLEREIKRAFGVKYAVVCNSGTAALHMALSALDLRGGEVITTPYTFSATAAAIIHAGGRPVFADVDPFTFCITPETVSPYVTKKTRAILPVHLFGGMADIKGLSSFGLPVVEDACQAVGARRGGRYSGTIGIAGCYSFNGTKNLPCGEGGALVTNSDKIAERARLIMNHAENFGAQRVGFNYRMTELEACVARHGLNALAERNRLRENLVDTLMGALGARDHETLRFPTWKTGEHAFYVFPFLYRHHSTTRKTFIERCIRRGLRGWISEGYVTPPLHHYPAFRQYAARELPVVDGLSLRTLCLLSCVRPPATTGDMCKVAKIIKGTL